jgi:hypothetical protein
MRADDETAQGMGTTVQVAGSKTAGFKWQLMDGDTTVRRGTADTEAAAVIEGQRAQAEYLRKRPRIGPGPWMRRDKRPGTPDREP